jgi:hypothetical protein
MANPQSPRSDDVFLPQQTLEISLRFLHVHDKSDFTVFVPVDAFHKSLLCALGKKDTISKTVLDGKTLQELLKDDQDPQVRWALGRKHFDFSCDVRLTIKTVTFDGSGRVHAAMCFAGKMFSVTLRSLKTRGGDLPKSKNPGLKPAVRNENKGKGRKRTQKAIHFLRTDKSSASICELPEKTASVPYLFSFNVLTDYVWERIAEEGAVDLSSGLILFAGATKSGKTQLLAGLLSKILAAKLVNTEGDSLKGRTPHVVAVGDPVETLLYGSSLKEAQKAIEKGTVPNRPVDFTARVVGIDVDSVAQATKDALRETPTVFVIDEIRSDDELVAALNLAATGHLVMATSHSSSLKDAMGKLVHAFKAETPSARAALAQRVRAIIHIRPFKSTVGTKQKSCVAALPAVWSQNPSAVHAFVSDGLSSLLFHSPEDQESFCFGYSHALDTELKRRESGFTGCDEVAFTDLREQAIERDLEIS